MDDQACPRCKTTKYRNPSLVLMVNICGHVLCESCVDLLFLKGSGACPECNIPLRRSNFRVQLLEDGMMEREVDIRKQVLRVYNKQQADFPNMRSYNDYLEEIEDIIFKLVNNMDVTSIQKQMEQYKKEHRELISKNKFRTRQEALELEEILAVESARDQERRSEQLSEEREESRKKVKSKEALLDELMFSDLDAKSIIRSHAQSLQSQESQEKKKRPNPPPQHFSSGIGFASTSGFLPIPKVDEGEPYRYEPLELPLEGPLFPWRNGVESGGYLANTKAASTQDKAGGYLSSITCQRVLQEAMAGLYFTYEKKEDEESEIDSS